MSSVHGLLARILVNLPCESLLVSCQQLYERFPPCRRGEGGSTGTGQARQKEEREKWRVVHSVPVKTYRQVLTRIVIY